ncbi:MAG TPA: hypothetical protein V6C91_06575 [Coleofasciculaceae cyanobacterium]
MVRSKLTSSGFAASTQPITYSTTLALPDYYTFFGLDAELSDRQVK